MIVADCTPIQFWSINRHGTRYPKGRYHPKIEAVNLYSCEQNPQTSVYLVLLRQQSSWQNYFDSTCVNGIKKQEYILSKITFFKTKILQRTKLLIDQIPKYQTKTITILLTEIIKLSTSSEISQPSINDETAEAKTSDNSQTECDDVNLKPEHVLPLPKATPRKNQKRNEKQDNLEYNADTSGKKQVEEKE